MPDTSAAHNLRTPISCKKAAQLLSESFERKLSLKKVMALKTHLAICKTCVSCSRQIKALQKLFHRYNKAVIELPPPASCCLPDDTRAKIKATLSQYESGGKKFSV